jgi:hypothetical protein
MFSSQSLTGNLLQVDGQEIYYSSLEANITENDFSISQTKSIIECPIFIPEATIINNVTPKSSPAKKIFVPPRTPIVPLNPFTDYDESKNPFYENYNDGINNPSKDNKD